MTARVTREEVDDLRKALAYSCLLSAEDEETASVADRLISDSCSRAARMLLALLAERDALEEATKHDSTIYDAVTDLAAARAEWAREAYTHLRLLGLDTSVRDKDKIDRHMRYLSEQAEGGGGA